MENKRKLYRVKSLQGKYIKYKNSHTKIENTVELDQPKLNSVNAFKLVVIKLPWYKKVLRSIKNFLGFGYYFSFLLIFVLSYFMLK